ncbi:uncharacterized protein LOC142173454 [Nicotiana tabacum]|uniref:Uncharacterized protein LOC142173454 n=1 Tax=Nicotiana tabacum TaxID=4097 RepID=A0AC58TD53_TOBAC
MEKLVDSQQMTFIKGRKIMDAILIANEAVDSRTKQKKPGILFMEGQNNMVKTAKSNGWIKGFEVARNGNNSLEITYLQYADDTLIFCDAEKEQLRFLRVILVLFEGISRLHVN